MIIDLSNPAHLFALSTIVWLLVWASLEARDRSGKPRTFVGGVFIVTWFALGATAVISLFQLIIKSL